MLDLAIFALFILYFVRRHKEMTRWKAEQSENISFVQ